MKGNNTTLLFSEVLPTAHWLPLVAWKNWIVPGFHQPVSINLLWIRKPLLLHPDVLHSML
jgi:hypothetical protein